MCCFSTCWGTLVCCLAREDTRRPTNANTAAFCLTSRNTLGVHNNTHSHSHPRHATFAKRVHRVHIWRDNIIWVIIILDYDQQQLTYMINKQCFDSFVLWVLVVFSFLTSVGASKSVFLYELRWNEKGVNTILKCQCKIKGWFMLLLLLLLFSLSAGLCLRSRAFAVSPTSWRKACMETQRTGGRYSPELLQRCLLCWWVVSGDSKLWNLSVFHWWRCPVTAATCVFTWDLRLMSHKHSPFFNFSTLWLITVLFCNIKVCAVFSLPLVFPWWVISAHVTSHDTQASDQVNIYDGGQESLRRQTNLYPLDYLWEHETWEKQE